jgi:hypothetical protein
MITPTSLNRDLASPVKQRIAGLLPIYLSRVPTADDVLKKYFPRARKFDVVGRMTPDGPLRVRWSWDQSLRPRRSQRTVMLNCYRWEAVWL